MVAYFCQKKLMRVIYLLFAVLFSFEMLYGQFTIALESTSIPGLPGLQSYVYGQYEGKLIFIGGRTDGLHMRQPFASFAAAANNTNIYVVDPVTNELWSASILGLSDGLNEQLQSTNMQFCQEGDNLYVLGGYGYSPSAGDHITFNKFLKIDLPVLIQSVINGESFISAIKTLEHPAFAVTGGQMELLDDIFYLVGGQNFIGRYNPMGPTHGPGFFQDYTDGIRYFEVGENQGNLELLSLDSIIDPIHLHRRDYNLVPQIFPDGKMGMTLFSGVFQAGQDLPFLYPVDIDSDGYTPQPDFNQLYSHYHSAHAALYDSGQKEMHTVFFGGISQYYHDTNDNLVSDENVPFVNTISQVTRYEDGTLSEKRLDEVMPGYFGASAEFIPLEGLPSYENGVIKLAELGLEELQIGYIFGGIKSSGPNIFFINTGVESEATSTLFKVFLTPDNTTELEVVHAKSNPLQVAVSPNPASEEVKLSLDIPESAKIMLTIQRRDGKVLDLFDFGQVVKGKYSFDLPIHKYSTEDILFFTLNAGKYMRTLKVLVQ